MIMRVNSFVPKILQQLPYVLVRNKFDRYVALIQD
jgi:hypothetical protein